MKLGGKSSRVDREELGENKGWILSKYKYAL